MCETKEEMDARTTSQKGVLSQTGKETVPRGKGHWRGRGRRGQNYGRPTNSDYHRQQPSDRRDAYNQPQRWGTMPDKRPQTRGFYQGRRELSKEVESGFPVTASRSGSKKYGTSLNHLLNFNYIPREKSVGYHLRSNRKSYTPFNKEQFIQANFQFVVCDSGDYTVHIMDPDVLVDWTFIEQVRIYSHEMPSCPICLYPPVAAKITRCGHIYCWSCMLHYLSLTDKSWHKCPICYEAVHKKDLKSVVTMESHPFAVGETITMRLMKRAKNSVLAVPKEQWRDRELKPFGVNDEEDTRCAKLLLASSEDVLKQIVFPEKVALETQLMEAKSEQSEEVCYIEAAIQEIKERHDSLRDIKAFAEEAKTLVKDVLGDQEKGTDNCCGVTTWKVLSPNAIQDVNEYEAAFSDEEDETTKPIYALDNLAESVSEESDVAFSPGESKVTEDVFCGGCNSKTIQEGTSENNSGDSSSESSRPLSPVPVPAQYYYFYQADDGQNVFLSPVNARCLVKEYGSLANCPDYVTGRIVEMEAMSQSEGLRKRCRYLSHLPLTCEFVICELELKPPVVSRATLDFYREELQHRKQQRQRKMRMEKKRDQKLIASGTSGSSGRSSGRGFVREKLDLSSEVEFPAQAGGQLALSPPSNATPSPFMQFAASIAAYQEEGNGAIVEAEGANQYAENLGVSPPSFAEALRSSKGIDIPRRVEARPRETVQVEKLGPGGEDESDDDCVPVPTFQSAFSDALVAANWTELEVHAEGNSAEQSGGKKQKKTKKKLLFTTGSFMKYT